MEKTLILVLKVTIVQSRSKIEKDWLLIPTNNFFLLFKKSLFYICLNDPVVLLCHLKVTHGENCCFLFVSERFQNVDLVQHFILAKIHPAELKSLMKQHVKVNLGDDLDELKSA
eukprot:snap_masked-scaffold_35-processed-gene-2.4-mRNA-1 protein AED:1.00 eAED:1.00 QI:0/0/0/0/1/1/5/0/113